MDENISQQSLDDIIRSVDFNLPLNQDSNLNIGVSNTLVSIDNNYTVSTPIAEIKSAYIDENDVLQVNYSNIASNYASNSKLPWASATAEPFDLVTSRTNLTTLKNYEFELLDGSKVILALSPDTVSSIKEIKVSYLEFSKKFPFFKRIDKKILSFFDEVSKNTYKINCSLIAFARTLNIEYTGFEEMILENTLLGQV